MPRQITYSIGTEYSSGPSKNYYNPTFTWDVVDSALNFLGKYWDIYFTRVNSGGRIRILQANKNPPSPGIAAWQNGFDIRIAPNYNFRKNRYLCALVSCHEFGHVCRQGGGHAKSPGLMDPNCTTPGGNLSPVDYWWFDVYGRKPGAPRPHEQPGIMRQTFVSALGEDTLQESLVEFGCDHSGRAWYDFRPDSWLVP